MSRWLVLACLLSCNGNGNGIHDVKNGGDADQDIDVHPQDIDVQKEVPEGVKPGEFYCLAVSGAKFMKNPCWETVDGCESNRTSAIINGYNVGECEKVSFAFCFHAKRDDFNGWDCRRTEALCDAAQKRQLSRGYEVSNCMRVPPEGWKKSSHRRRPRERRTAGR